MNSPTTFKEAVDRYKEQLEACKKDPTLPLPKNPTYPSVQVVHKGIKAANGIVYPSR